MKRTHILLLFAALAVSAFAAVKKPLVSSVEPPDRKSVCRERV